MRYPVATLSALLLSFTSQSVSAFDLGDYLVGQGDDAVHYLNPSAIKQRGGMLTAWVVTDRRTPNAKKVWSAKELIAFDCANEQVNYLSSVGYSQPGGRGASLYSETYRVPEWTAVVPGTIMASTMEVVCSVASGTPIDEAGNAVSYDLIAFARTQPEKNPFWWLDSKFHAR